MKSRLLIGTAMGVAMLVSSLPVYAQSAADTQAQINAMQAQIQALQQQLSAIKAQTTAPAAAASSGPASSDGILSTAVKYLDSDDTLTWHGVTLYATVDAGVSNQSHGTPFNGDSTWGVEELVSKNSNHAITSVTPNGLSQSTFGVRATEELWNGFSLVARGEGGFDPVTGTLVNGPKSLASNNGIALANQTSNADSSRAGQLFNNVLYVGVSNPTYGQVTFGRHLTPLAEALGASDPQGGSYAFSLIGFSGTAGGGGTTEDTRLDDSIKYNVKYGPVRFAALYQFPGNTNSAKGDDAYYGNVGVDYAGLTVDLVYGHKNGAIAASNTATALGSLVSTTAVTAAQAASIAAGKATTLTGATPLTLAALSSTDTVLAATVSDNTTMMVTATYTPDFLPFKVKLFGGYEQIRYYNPSTPLLTGSVGLGGYPLVTNNAAYNEGKQNDYYWAGIKYYVIPEVTLTPAYYRVEQNNYSGLTQVACLTAAKGSCTGSENVASFVVDWNLTKRFDLYAGVMYSHVEQGLGVGFINNNDVSDMIGGRVKF